MNRLHVVAASVIATTLLIFPLGVNAQTVARKHVKPPTGSAVQKATVIIDGGYKPATVKVTAGKPVELTFIRKSAAGCDGELVIPNLKVDKALKQGEKTVVKFTPKKGQTLGFSCGMNMYKGQVVVN